MLGTIAVILLVLVAFTPIILIDVYAESFLVSFDKEFYSVGEELKVSGEILDYGMPIIAMSVYDPNGKILSANNLEISSDKTFSKLISLDSSFYEKPGEYTIKFDYGQISKEFLFIIDSEFTDNDELFEELFEPEIILLYTEQAQYSDGETVVVTGLVSSVESPTVLIGIYDPFGLPAGFYFGTINSDLEFSTNFLVKSGVNFRTEGTYSVKAHYGESEAKSFFDYYENIPDSRQQQKTFQTQQQKTFQTHNNIPDTTTENIPDTTTENIPDSRQQLKTFQTQQQKTFQTQQLKTFQTQQSLNNHTLTMNHQHQVLNNQKLQKFFQIIQIRK